MEFGKFCRERKYGRVVIALLIFQLCWICWSAQGGEEAGYVQDNEDAVYEQESEEIENTQDSVGTETNQDYPTRFHEEIQAIVSQAEDMSSISIFTKNDGFTSKNIEKTASDYEPLLDVEPAVIEDAFLDAFLNDHVLNVILLVCALLTAFCYTEERRPGLRAMIFASKNGRGRKVLHKFGAMLLWDGILASVFLVLSLLVYTAVYGQNLPVILGCTVQSVELLGRFTCLCSIGEFLVLFFLFRWAVMFVITVVAWLLLFLTDHMLLSVGVIGIVGIAEYLMEALIPASHPLAVLRYCNLYYLVWDSSFFTEYRNLNVFGIPVGKGLVIGIVGVVVLVAAMTAGVIRGEKVYPIVSDNKMGFVFVRAKQVKRNLKFAGEGTEKANVKISRCGKQDDDSKMWYKNGWANRISILQVCLEERLTLTAAELYKLLICRRGFVVVAFYVAFIILQISSNQIQWTKAQLLYYDFMEEYEGIPNEDSAVFISSLEEEIEEVEMFWANAQEEYAQGSITYNECYEAMLYYDSYEDERDFLTKIRSQTDYLESLEETAGISGWYVNSYSYENLLGTGEEAVDGILVFVVILLCSSMFSWEKDCGIAPVTRAAEKGREDLFRRKLAAAAGVGTIMYLFTDGVRVWSVIDTYGLGGLAAPVQSLESLEFVSFTCNLGGFFALLYMERGLIVVTMAVFAAMLSAYVGQKLIAGIFLVLCIPMVLAEAGVAFLEQYSIAGICSVTGILMQLQEVRVLWVIGGFCVAVLCISIECAYRKWCRT